MGQTAKREIAGEYSAEFDRMRQALQVHPMDFLGIP